MKSERGLLLLMFVVCSFSVLAQTGNGRVEVKGVVIEEGSNLPVEQATIRLLNVKDSTLINGVASSRNGSFSLKNIRPGNYLLHITFVGFEPLYQPLQITGKVNPVELGKLELADGSILLGEAVIVGKMAEVVVRNDTIEYNADSYKVTEGSVLEDLLKKMPGVEIDSEGKITVNGKEIKKIMVDGKEFFSDDPKVASKNLPAEMIDKLQVLDKKSDMTMMTGFDDGDEETIINLTVKPGMKQGWFGNAFAGYGSEDRYEGNFMVNRFYNNDQFTIMGGINNTNNMGFTDLASTMFQGMGGGGGRGRMGGGFGGGSGITTSGNIGINFSKEFSKTLTLTGNVRYNHSDNEALSRSKESMIMSGDSLQYRESESNRNRKNDNIGANFRLEWKPDTLTQVIFRPDISYSKSRNRSISNYTTFQGLNNMATADLDSVNMSESNSFGEGDGYNFSGRLELSRKLNSKGRVLSGSFSGGYNRSDEDGTNLSNTWYYGDNAMPDLSIDQEYTYKNTGYNYRAYVSWVEPLGRNNFLQATYSFSQRKQEALKYTYSNDGTGEYNQLDTAYSQSYRNDFISQRVSLSFKSQREKFNYTIGLNLDPSNSKSENFIGDTILSTIKQNVVNLSPMAQFNYIFNKQMNLRINYNGRTSQPSMTQLQPVADISDPNYITIGNPDLKPTYSNNLFIRFHRFVPEKQMALMVMANGGYVVNDIVSDVTDMGGGKKMTTYRNTNGNYNGNVRVIMNTPLKNKKFTINTMTMASYANSNAYIDNDKNTTKNLRLMERAGIDFRSDIIDLGLNGNIQYNKINYSLQPDYNKNTFDYGIGGTTVIYLPWDFKIESDINYNSNSGYGSDFQLKEVLWNASASKSFLKGNQATLRVKVYDILKQRSSISQNITSTGYTESEYNTLGSYFMVHFVYRFSIFKGGATVSDAMGGRRGPGGGRPPRMRF